MSDVEVLQIVFPSSVQEINPQDDNVDVHVSLSDGRMFSFLVSTPNNIDRCMRNEGIEHFFSDPPALFVRVLDQGHVRAAILALLSENSEKWLSIYGVLQPSQTSCG